MHDFNVNGFASALRPLLAFIASDRSRTPRGAMSKRKGYSHVRQLVCRAKKMKVLEVIALCFIDFFLALFQGIQGVYIFAGLS